MAARCRAITRFLTCLILALMIEDSGPHLCGSRITAGLAASPPKSGQSVSPAGPGWSRLAGGPAGHSRSHRHTSTSDHGIPGFCPPGSGFLTPPEYLAS